LQWVSVFSSDPRGALSACWSRHANYAFTVSHPTIWTSPWTAIFPIERIDGPMCDYACYEGNLGLLNILTAARVNEEAPR